LAKTKKGIFGQREKKTEEDFSKEIPVDTSFEFLKGENEETKKNFLTPPISQNFEMNNSSVSHSKTDDKESSLFDAPDILKNDLNYSNETKTSSKPSQNETSAKSGGEFSIFGEKNELSRIELRQKMRKSPEIWKAQKAVGLSMTPVERAKLENQVFSQALGRNISKNDLMWSIKKLNNKLILTKDQKEHEKIRKEIKFFKKIGGIK